MKNLIDYHPVIMKKVEDIMKQEGHRTFSGAVFATISNYYDKKYFDKYKKDPNIKIIPEDILTNEQKCEKAGGSIVTENGILKCKLPQNKDGSMFISFPVGMINKYT